MNQRMRKEFSPILKRFFGLAFLVFLLAGASADAAAKDLKQVLPPGNAQQLTTRQAVRTLLETMPKINMYSTGWGPRKAEGGKLTATGFSVTSSGKVHEFAFSSFTSYIVVINNELVFDVPGAKNIVFGWDKKANGYEYAHQSTDALNRLIYDAQRGVEIPVIENPAANWASFQKEAAQWRALSARPELPEEVRKQRTLAESYLRDKDFNGAIEHYELGVKSCSTWPEGWYNLALLYGETHDYAEAADSMKHYLELMPNSPDAQAARDKIVIWEDRAGKPQTKN
jgi:tetratricopeptide (TPR) repeat protein